MKKRLNKKIRLKESGFKKELAGRKRSVKAERSFSKDKKRAAAFAMKVSRAVLAPFEHSKGDSLHETKGNYRDILSRTREAVVLIDLKTDYIFYCNSKFEDLCGRKLKQLRKMRIWELSSAEKKKTVKKRYIEAKTNPGGIFNEIEFQKPNKETKQILLASSLIVIKDKQYIQSIAKDITDLRRKEAELHWEKEVSSAVYKLSSVLITASPSILHIANIVLDSAKSLTQSEHGFVSSIDPETRDNIGHTLTAMLGSQCLVSIENRLIRFPIGPNGRYPGLWGHALNSRESFLTNAPDKHEASRGVPEGHIPIKNFLSVPALVNHELVGQIALANSARNYTDSDLELIKRLAQLYAIAIQRKRAEEELQTQKHELGERVKELNCLYGIANLVQQSGISLEEIMKGTINLIPRAFQYPEITCARLILRDQILKTSNFRETIWKQASDITAKGNQIGTLEVYYLEERPERDEGPFLMEERNLINAIAERLGRIIERKKAEEEVQKLNESLKSRAAELAAANKELEAFSYSISHDLRAPLRAIDGFSQALLEDYFDKLAEEGKDYLERIRSAVKNMAQMLEALLKLSLATTDPMRREETNLSEMAKAIASELRTTLPERRVDFIIQEGMVARGDTRLLRHVLENLLNNAWKFTMNCPGARIEFASTEKEGQTIYFVRDNGAGFDMTYADKLFIPFQRLHSTSEFSGEGIGLAIVSRIIHRHGGRTWAEGEVDKGATFYFTLQ